MDALITLLLSLLAAEYRDTWDIAFPVLIALGLFSWRIVKITGRNINRRTDHE